MSVIDHDALLEAAIEKLDAEYAAAAALAGARDVRREAYLVLAIVQRELTQRRAQTDAAGLLAADRMSDVLAKALRLRRRVDSTVQHLERQHWEARLAAEDAARCLR